MIPGGTRPESAAERRRRGRQMAVDALVRRTLALSPAGARGAEIRRAVRRARALRLAWKAAAAAAVVLLAVGVYGRVGRAPPPSGEARSLVAAAGQARTPADLRALAPRIRAASEQLLAQGDFEPRDVLGLEFARAAAEMARADWQVAAPALCIRRALVKPAPAAAAGAVELFPSAVAAEPRDGWKVSFAQGLRSWHAGRYQDAAWTFTGAKGMPNVPGERQRWDTVTAAMLLLQYQHPEALDNSTHARYDAPAIARNNLDWLFTNEIYAPTPLDERDVIAMWIVADCLEHRKKGDLFWNLLVTANRPQVLIAVEQRLKRAPPNDELTASVQALYRRAQTQGWGWPPITTADRPWQSPFPDIPAR